MKRILLATAMIPCLAMTGAFADVLEVPSEYPTIQDAINAASSGDTVLVAPGTYPERIRFQGKEIEVRSSGGAEVTTIDGSGGDGPVVRFLQGEGTGAILDGFTITGGTGKPKGSRTYGGGILGLDASPTIRNNHIVENTAGVGGGAAFGGGAPVLENNEIRDNAALSPANNIFMLGGGLAFFGGSPEVVDNRILGNELRGDDMGEGDPGRGAGIYGIDLTNAVMTGNDIEYNRYMTTVATSGGGIYLEGAGDATISGNRIIHNQSCDGGGIVLVDHVSFIEGNWIQDNYGDCSDSALGGGVLVQGGLAEIGDNVFLRNNAYRGGGIGAMQNAVVTIVGNLLTENFACKGGGIAVACGGAAIVTNNTIVENVLCDLFGGEAGGAMSGDSILATNCIMRDNRNLQQVEKEIEGDPTITYSNVGLGWPGEGNIDEEPMFVDAVGGDYHLRLESPCVDAGDNFAPLLPETDWDGDDRILDGDGEGHATADMGVDELNLAVAVRYGNVRYVGSDDLFAVMRVNGSYGDADRIVRVPDGGSIDLTIVKPPAGGSGKMVIHGNLGAPTQESVTQLPASVGLIGFPLLLPEATPSVIWNNIGKIALVGESEYFGGPVPDPLPAPTTLLELSAGDPVNLPLGTTITFQGVIVDPGSASPRGASVTNAVVLLVE